MIDNKAAAGTVGGALAFLVWTLLAAFVGAVQDLDAETLVTLTGATATVFTAALAFLVPNLASRIRKAYGEQVLEAIVGADGTARVVIEPGASAGAARVALEPIPANVEIDAIPVSAHEGAVMGERGEDPAGETPAS